MSQEYLPLSSAQASGSSRLGEGFQVDFYCKNCRNYITLPEWQQHHNTGAHWVVPISFLDDNRLYFPGNSQTNDYSDGSDIVTVYNEAYSQLSRQPNANTSKIVLLEREVVSLKETMEKFIKDFQTFEAKSDMFQKHQQQGQQQGRQVDEQSQEKGNRRNQLLETRSNDQREDEEIQRPHPYTATLHDQQQQSSSTSSQRQDQPLPPRDHQGTFSNSPSDRNYYETIQADRDEINETSSNEGDADDSIAGNPRTYGYPSYLEDSDYTYPGSKLIITTGKTKNIALPPPSPDNHVKIKMDSSGFIYVFQTTWRNSNPVESKLKIFNMHDNPLIIHKKWKWVQEKQRRFSFTRNIPQYMPVDIALCMDEIHIVAKTGNSSFGVEKWRKMSDVKTGEVHLAQTGIDSLSTLSISGARNYLLMVQRKSDRSLHLVIMDRQVVRLSCALNISVERQPKFSVNGDYLLFPHANSFDIVNWREGSTIITDATRRTIRTVNIEGDRWVVGSFTLGDMSTYVIELHNDQQENGTLYQTEQLEPIMLDHSQISGLRQRHLGLFSSALAGVILFYNEQIFGLLQVTTPTAGYEATARDHPLIGLSGTRN
ncbi:uncharacterized protein LOC142349301 isoform X2 [Convolutriloba macropyga]|uniref:uncharacterized protein LOC142349301 isoform X2 n=1 Tax=Convolutriloba macropyga TaxID=536237 RepID=UPI003F521EF7